MTKNDKKVEKKIEVKAEAVEAAEAAETAGAAEVAEAAAPKRSLNEKIADLDARVEWFYSDEFRLEDAVANYKSATKLAKSIEKELATLKNEIEVLSDSFGQDSYDDDDDDLGSGLVGGFDGGSNEVDLAGMPF